MPRRPKAAHAAAQHPLISDKQLQHLYITLLRCRLLRQRDRVRQLATPLVAREAIVTGTVAHLLDGDLAAPTAGDKLPALALGHSLRSIRSEGPIPGMLPAALTAEATLSIAAGYAMAQQGKKHIVLAFGGPVVSLDALRPALAYAAQHKLGIVFVIETAASADVSSAKQTDALGLYGIPVDGNDVVAVYRVAQEAITRARRGLGPTLIDCKPWPLDGVIDPVRKLEQSLERRGLLDRKLAERTVNALKKALAATPRRGRS